MKIKTFLEKLEKQPECVFLLAGHHDGSPIGDIETDGCNIWLIPSEEAGLSIKEICKRIINMNCPGTGLVRMEERDGARVMFVESFAKDPNTVWVESEADIDMHSEIEARLNYPMEQLKKGIDIDETDFYREMLYDGIDVYMVERYAGERAAIHMKNYCEEHGLLPKYTVYITHLNDDNLYDAYNYGEYDTKEEAYRRVCRLVGRKAFAENDDFSIDGFLKAQFDAYNYTASLYNDCSHVWTHFNVIEVEE